MDTSLPSRIDLLLFLLTIKRFQHLCYANRAETQLLVRRSCRSSGRLRCRQMSKGTVAQNPLNQRAEELEDGDKRGEGGRISTREREEEWKERKHKEASKFLRVLPSDLLKFLIPSLLSDTQDPFPASITPSAKPVPLVPFKTPLFLIAVKALPAPTWSFTAAEPAPFAAIFGRDVGHLPWPYRRELPMLTNRR